jgi:hypothetical protein
VTTPGFQAGPITISPATENIPAVNAPGQALAGGAAVCNAYPPGPNGDVAPVVSGRVCQQLWAQIATTDVNAVPPSVTLNWVTYGSSTCNPLVPGSTVAAANQAFQVYSNLPGSGSGSWYNGQPTQIYTGLYDSVVSAWGYEDGVAVPAPQCADGSSSCNNYPFEV